MSKNLLIKFKKDLNDPKKHEAVKIGFRLFNTQKNNFFSFFLSLGFPVKSPKFYFFTLLFDEGLDQ
jgi:hypothetical protein